MRPIDTLREKIDLWKKSTTDTALMSVLHDVLQQIDVAIYEMDHQEAASPWRRVEDGLPKKAGEYIVAYHPCWWDDVKTSVTEVGIDTFRGKTSWAKRKFQRVTHWMDKPEPPKEE